MLYKEYMMKTVTDNTNKSFPYGELDVLEQGLYDFDKTLLETLLIDRSTGANIIWGTSDYRQFGESFAPEEQVRPELVTCKYASLIQPRSAKSKEEQERRTRDKAEVFTPSWVCNKQNNIVDQAWFGRKRTFNRERGSKWTTIQKPVVFSNKKGRTWKDYVTADRLEITCGEAPYLVSRYDTTTGEIIPVHRRIGLLDRKLRVVCENTRTKKTWHKWALEAFKSIYGYDYQGDNVLLARENMLYSYADYYKEKFGAEPEITELKEIAGIISWNIWQMDGIKYVVPNTCHLEEKTEARIVGDDISEITTISECPGCRSGNKFQHNGIYAIIMDWKNDTPIRFVDVIRG